MKRIFGLVIGVTTVVGLGVGSAGAIRLPTPYPVGVPSLTASSGTPTAGTPITYSVTGFCPGGAPSTCLPVGPVTTSAGVAPAGCTVVFTLGATTLGSVVATVAGVASLTVPAPAASGPATVTATSSAPCVGTASAVVFIWYSPIRES